MERKDQYTEAIRNIEALKETIRDLPNSGAVGIGNDDEARRQFNEMMKVASERIKRMNRMIANLEEIEMVIQDAQRYYNRLEETVQRFQDDERK